MATLYTSPVNILLGEASAEKKVEREVGGRGIGERKVQKRNKFPLKRAEKRVSA
jgi:hypothetical protein